MTLAARLATLAESLRSGAIDLGMFKRLCERAAVLDALADAGGSVTHAARALGIDRVRLERRIRQLALRAELRVLRQAQPSNPSLSGAIQ